MRVNLVVLSKAKILVPNFGSVVACCIFLLFNQNPAFAMPISTMFGLCKTAAENNFDPVPSTNLLCIGYWHGVIDQAATNCVMLNVFIEGKETEEVIEWQSAKSLIASSAKNTDVKQVILDFVEWAESQTDQSAPIGGSLHQWFTKRWPCAGTPEVLLIE